jgi:hypothetical protein
MASVYEDMNSEWIWKQVLMAVRGMALLLIVVCAFIALQFLPPFLHGGPAAVREYLIRVATAGVPEERWPMAIFRMQEALGILAGAALGSWLLQRVLARRVVH